MPLSSLSQSRSRSWRAGLLRAGRTTGLCMLAFFDAALASAGYDRQAAHTAGRPYHAGQTIGTTAFVMFLVGASLAVAVIWRQRQPVALAVGGAAAAVLASMGPTVALIGLMSTVVRKPRELAIRVAVPVAAATLYRVSLDVNAEPREASFWGSLFAQGGEPISWYVPLVLTALLVGLFGGTGLWLRTRAELSTAHEVVAEEREHVSTLTDRLSRQAERERIAREIHDGLGHNLSILSIHANALEAMADATADSTSGPEDGGRMATQLRESALVVRQQAAQTVTELHGLLDILRNPDDPDAAAPTKTLRDVRALVDESVTAGMPLVATVFVEGSEDADPHVAQAAYRIVQELLTNARKHVPTVPVRLSVTGGPGEGALTITTANHVPPPRATGQPRAERGRRGTGLSGIRERVERYGGQMSAGADPDGVFRVSVRLPWAPPETTARRHER